MSQAEDKDIVAAEPLPAQHIPFSILSFLKSVFPLLLPNVLLVSFQRQ